jgi:hypothetical protein
MKTPGVFGLMMLLAGMGAGAAWAETNASSAFLSVGPGARPAALAECYAALASGPFGCAYNPAGLAAATSVAFGLQHHEWVQDIRLEYLAAQAPLGPGAIFGAVEFVNYGQLEIWDANAQQTGEVLAPFDLAASAAYGLALAPEWQVGASLTVTQSVIGDFQDTGVGATLGALWRTPWPGVTAAMVAKNLGASASGYLFPMRGIVAVSYAGLPEDALQADVEVSAPLATGEFEAGLGAEYTLWRMLGLRLGYRWNAGGMNDPLSGLAAGLGVTWQNLEFGYALRPLGDYGLSHQISLAYSLAPLRPEISSQAVKDHFASGLEQYEKKAYKGAIAEFKLVLEFAPDHAEAKEYLERSAREMEIERQRLYRKADEARARNDFATETRTWREVLALDDQDPRARENVWLDMLKPDKEEEEEEEEAAP